MIRAAFLLPFLALAAPAGAQTVRVTIEGDAGLIVDRTDMFGPIGLSSSDRAMTASVTADHGRLTSRSSNSNVALSDGQRSYVAFSQSSFTDQLFVVAPAGAARLLARVQFDRRTLSATARGAGLSNAEMLHVGRVDLISGERVFSVVDSNEVSDRPGLLPEFFQSTRGSNVFLPRTPVAGRVSPIFDIEVTAGPLDLFAVSQCRFNARSFRLFDTARTQCSGSLTWLGMQALDGDGNLLPGLSVSSLSGFDYVRSYRDNLLDRSSFGPADVPAPAAAALFGLGGIGLALRRRRA